MIERQRVSLARTNYPSVQSSISAYISDDGNLIIEGQDLGPGVSSVWGDSDYEYWVTVKAEHFDTLTAALSEKLGEEPTTDDNDRATRTLLSLLKEGFSREAFKTDSDFRQWLNTQDIPSEFFSYT